MFGTSAAEVCQLHKSLHRNTNCLAPKRLKGDLFGILRLYTISGELKFVWHIYNIYYFRKASRGKLCILGGEWLNIKETEIEAKHKDTNKILRQNIL